MKTLGARNLLALHQLEKQDIIKLERFIIKQRKKSRKEVKKK